LKEKRFWDIDMQEAMTALAADTDVDAELEQF